MANIRDSEQNHEYATVDTLPGATGYYTNEVCPRDLLNEGSCKGKIYFSIRETVAEVSEAPSDVSVVTVVLQYKCLGDADWTDYQATKKLIASGTASDEISEVEESFQIGNRVEIEDIGYGVRWRAGVRSDEYTSGSVTFGFDW
jgi:hypothetical protein